MSPVSPKWLIFTRRERIGALLLLFISSLCWVAPEWVSRFRERERVDFSSFEAQVALLAPAEGQERAPVQNSPAALFPFDPNQAGEEQLLRLGLPPSVARTIVRYRNKGGRFRRASDLQKIYRLSPADYQRLAPYVRIPQSGKQTDASPVAAPSAKRLFPFDPNTVKENELTAMGLPDRVVRTWMNYRRKGGRFHRPADLAKLFGLSAADLDRLLPFVQLPPAAAPDSAVTPPPPDITIDINRADAAAWQRLRGIGPVLSDRIVRFRDRLGGFASVDQVAETYGLPDSTFTAIRSHLRSSPLLRPLAVNQLNEESLSRHPYLNRRQARAIVAFREQHGPFASPEEVAKVRALPEALHRKLAPYWSFHTEGE